jgi:tryptophan-rich hypothetical protein
MKPTRLSAKKLHLSKWTAVAPQAKEKHWLVAQLVQPQPPTVPPQPVVEVVIEAVYSGRRQTIAWRELTDPTQWRQGWV